MDYRNLLIKYMVHLCTGEGESYATDYRFISPANMGDMSWTEEEMKALDELIPEVIRIHRRPHSEWFPEKHED